ncbi:MAG: redoxin domain-containing protein, partial [Verrucomicrobiaceae bacterium]|nr:redoxin domain-containing protein [Verrucomicrobiaceae bacterium]
AEQDKAVAAAKTKAVAAKKNPKDIEKAAAAAAKNFEKAVSGWEHPLRELTAYRHLTATPPDPAAAIALLPELKNLAKWRHASLWQRAGDGAEALKLAAAAVKAGENEVLPLATQVRLLHQNGEKEKAKEAFTRLRTVAGHADPDLAIFAPLAAIAKEFGFPEDWRQPAAPADDLGPRPDLDTLGPFRWSPPAAPDFTLPDAAGKPTSLSHLRTRPVVLIFFLGKGCLHCMEQLNAFAPLHARFDAAGIDLVAISTNAVPELRETLTDGGDGTKEASDEGGSTAAEEGSPFPFPLLSDTSLATFKDYRAYDDFEKQPLHGTFLIDPDGRIRWQEIGYEPFMHPEWLLEESRRLLSLKTPAE